MIERKQEYIKIIVYHELKSIKNKDSTKHVYVATCFQTYKRNPQLNLCYR